MLRTFPKGGVHPPENKLTASKPIRRMPVPKVVYVPIAQHIGIPAEIAVAQKDKVQAGQVIARSGGVVSSNIHAPVAGTVTKLDKIVDTRGYKKQCIVIRTDLKDESNFQEVELPLKQEITMEPDEILKRISDFGIVGLGGATFPSHVKLNIKEGKKLDCLIINGVECEPYLTSDHRLMLEKNEDILVGIRKKKKSQKQEKKKNGKEKKKKNEKKKKKNKTRQKPGKNKTTQKKK